MSKQENFSAPIPSELVNADEVLTRYGRWASCGGGNSCPHTLDRMYIREADRRESLEAYVRRRNYVPPEALMPVQEALAAQRALASVPDRERIVLGVLYVPKRMPIGMQLRILRIPPRLCRTRHLAGLRTFDDRLRVVTMNGRSAGRISQQRPPFVQECRHLSNEHSAAAA